MKLESEIKSLNARIRQYDPISRSGRQRKANIDVVAAIKTIIDGYGAQFRRNDIKVDLCVDQGDEARAFVAKLVPGLFHSEYEVFL